MKTTLKDIADMAGVSPGTVDRALHNRGRVNPEVAERIRKLARELGYKPNAIAKGLSRRKDNLRITIILHIKKTNTFFDDVLVGIKQGYDELVDISCLPFRVPFCGQQAQFRIGVGPASRPPKDGACLGV